MEQEKIWKTVVVGLKEIRWVVLAVLMGFMISAVFLQGAEVHGHSMVGSLTDGDNLLVSRFAGQYLDLKQGDIVVLKDTPADDDKYLVKRVLATGGDVIRFEGRDVWVNDVLLEEDYIYRPQEDYEFLEVEVKAGEIFVVGDNRSDKYASSDSRLFGALSVEKHVEAKALYNFSTNQIF